jgi:shikimate kinase / 3-dehydroquinate synthase
LPCQCFFNILTIAPMTTDERTANLIITGFSGTGKSVVAREVARMLNRECLDTDDEVVKRAGRPIADIFRQEGEDRFRELEREAISSACKGGPRVIAIGGGAIVDRQNYRLLSESGLIVCLEARPETIYRRLFDEAAHSPETEVRPLLAGDDPPARIRQLKASRQPYYADVDWTVHTDGLSIGQVAVEVVRAWRLIHGIDSSRLSIVSDDAVACLVETPSQSYPVFVGYGLLDQLGERMRETGLCGTAIIISDENVLPIYGPEVEEVLSCSGFAVNSLAVPAGEETKSIDYADRIFDALVEHRVERDDVIVALGGGVVGDLAGFVAATFLRGISWVQVPTSLVAMVDASIGGKVGINHPEGKNLIGAFHQPKLVMADCQTLATLPERELVSGWAEVVKHGLILDEELLVFLEANADRLVELEPEAVTQAIARSAAIKAGVVSEDERERAGRRIILNYGHTIGHGLEAATGYERFLHGEAVSIGMMGAAKLSARLGLLSSEVVNRQRGSLQRLGLPVSLAPAGSAAQGKRGERQVSLAEVARAMELDKKTRDRAIRWVLLRDIGKAVIRSDVPGDDVLAVLQELAEP